MATPKKSTKRTAIDEPAEGWTADEKAAIRERAKELKVRGEKPLIPPEHRGRFGEGVEL